MEKMKRGDKIYLDKEQTKESRVNRFLECRDGVIEVYEYRDTSGYGTKTRLFYCQNTKHEVDSIIRQTYNENQNIWQEEEMVFDSDSFVFLKALIKGINNEFEGKYSKIRDYAEN